MRKRNHFRQLGRTPTHKMAMLRNMVTSLIEHERIVTTLAKAKELQRLAERVITMAKKATYKATQALSPSVSSSVSSVATTNTTQTNGRSTSASALDVTVDNGMEPPTPSTATETAILEKQQKQGYDTATSQLVHAHRQISRIVRTDWATQKVMNVLRHRYDLRQGGYTRIMKLSKPRMGDKANMAIIEYIDHPNEVRAARPPTATTTQRPAVVLNDDGTASTTGTYNKILTSIQLQQQLQTLRNIHAINTGGTTVVASNHK